MTETAADTVDTETAAPPVATRASPFGGDAFAMVACCLIWGTTWFAITKQFGVVAPLVSLTYRFGSAAAILFVWLLITRRRIGMTRGQHLAVAAQGFFTFTINYAFVYFAEERIASAVTAVSFAGLAFINLILFRFTLGQKAPRAVWIGAALGLAGVGVISWAELLRARMDATAWTGLGFAFAAVFGAAGGNFFAHKAQHKGVNVTVNTAWAMGYGALMLAICAVVTGAKFNFDPTLGYVGSLIYLSVFGSVIAFVLYFGLARRRGYTFASYISAVTPLIAMAVSAVFEHAHWGVEAAIGLALVVAGQVLLVRARKV
jgi:drug/metabolite transporter (DMT)-like permease